MIIAAKRIIAVATVFLLVAGGARAQTFTPLHEFSSGDGGAFPDTKLILSDDYLYGSTSGYNNSGIGTIFRVSADGTGFTILHNFTDDGSSADLILEGGVLYGTTFGLPDGTNVGTVFKINADGTGFTNLYHFTGSSDNTNAANPGQLALSGTTLYGTTENGGAYHVGTVFKINTDGTGISVLYSFTAGSDGAYPGGLILSGDTLYGATSGGVIYGYGTVYGTVFKINTDGTGFATLQSFGSGTPSSLVLSGNTLYGTTSFNPYISGSEYATIFKVNTDGTGFTNLFDSFDSDGAWHYSDLILSGNTLYGTAGGTSVSYGFGGGDFLEGAVFKINTDGSDFTNLYSFTGNSDGAEPNAGLVLSGNILYGTTEEGGAFNDGTVFAVNVDGSGFSNLHSFTGDNLVNSDGAVPNAGLILSSNTLYGTASGGGSSGNGTVFKINTDGTGFTNLHSFTALDPFSSTNSDGAAPNAGLILSSNTLYGTASGGGSSGNGTVFKINTDGTGFTNLHSFTLLDPTSSTNSDGIWPYAGLILSGNTLYGTASGGGNSGSGTVFKVNADGTGFTNLHSFTALDPVSSTNSDGAWPDAGLILSGNTLYGTASGGGSSANGTVFKVNTDGTGFTNLYSFTAVSLFAFTNSDGAYPLAGLSLSGNTLYGTASGGGSSGNGAVFKVNADGTGFTDLYSFTSLDPASSTNSDGAVPNAGLILSSNTLYGTASGGGSSGNGTVFKLDLSALSPIPLNIQRTDNQVILSWINPVFVLQSAPAVTGTFTNVPGATSPYTNIISESQLLFRLKGN